MIVNVGLRRFTGAGGSNPSGGSALLKEDSFFILLEDGSKILLE